MAFHLETHTGSSVHSRTGLWGANLEEAKKSADRLLGDDDVAARIMEAASGNVGFGNGQMVASYTAADGWQEPGE